MVRVTGYLTMVYGVNGEGGGVRERAVSDSDIHGILTVVVLMVHIERVTSPW